MHLPESEGKTLDEDKHCTTVRLCASDDLVNCHVVAIDLKDPRDVILVLLLRWNKVLRELRALDLVIWALLGGEWRLVLIIR